MQFRYNGSVAKKCHAHLAPEWSFFLRGISAGCVLTDVLTLEEVCFLQNTRRPPEVTMNRIWNNYFSLAA